MKQILLIISCFGGMALQAQVIEKSNLTDKDYFARKLVELAWENDPHSKAVRQNVILAEYDVKLSKMEWLNTVTVSGNLNEFNIDPSNDVNDRSSFYPKYNVGARISLGMFFTIPYTTQKNRQQMLISETMVEERKVALEAEVLRRYNDYLMYEKMYRLKAEMVMDAENKFQVSEEKFRSGEIPFEEYSNMRSGVNTAQLSLYETEAAYENAKVSLEELIGVKLETISR